MTSSAEILLPYALEPEDVSTITHPQPTSTPTHPPLPLLEPPGGCMGLKHGEVYSRKGACPDKTSGPFNGRPRPGIRPPLLGPRRALQHRHTNISSGRPKWKTQTRNIEISSGRGEGERWDSRKKRRGGSLVSQTCWKTLCADEDKHVHVFSRCATSVPVCPQQCYLCSRSYKRCILHLQQSEESFHKSQKHGNVKISHKLKKETDGLKEREKEGQSCSGQQLSCCTWLHG